MPRPSERIYLLNLKHIFNPFKFCFSEIRSVSEPSRGEGVRKFLSDLSRLATGADHPPLQAHLLRGVRRNLVRQGKDLPHVQGSGEIMFFYLTFYSNEWCFENSLSNEGLKGFFQNYLWGSLSWDLFKTGDILSTPTIRWGNDLSHVQSSGGILFNSTFWSKWLLIKIDLMVEVWTYDLSVIPFPLDRRGELDVKHSKDTYQGPLELLWKSENLFNLKSILVSILFYINT